MSEFRDLIPVSSGPVPTLIPRGGYAGSFLSGIILGMTRRVAPKWTSLSWEVVAPEEPIADDVAVRLVAPELEGGGRVVIRFGVRPVELGDGTPAFDVLAPVAFTIEGPDGDHVAPETVVSLRKVPLGALIDSARVIARTVLARPGRGRTGSGADALDDAIARFGAVRHLGSNDQDFMQAFGEVLDLVDKTHPNRPLAFLADALGVGRSTVGRWASEVRAAREGGEEGKR